MTQLGELYFAADAMRARAFLYKGNMGKRASIRGQAIAIRGYIWGYFLKRKNRKPLAPNLSANCLVAPGSTIRLKRKTGTPLAGSGFSFGDLHSSGGISAFPLTPGHAWKQVRHRGQPFVETDFGYGNRPAFCHSAALTPTCRRPRFSLPPVLLVAPVDIAHGGTPHLAPVASRLAGTAIFRGDIFHGATKKPKPT